MRAAFVVYGPLEQVTGGYLYDQAVRAELLGRGWAVDTISLPAVLPGLHVEHTGPLLRRLLGADAPDIVVEDGLASGSCLLANVALRVRRRPRTVALVHHLSWSEARHGGETRRARLAARAREWAALAAAHRVVVTSEHTRREVVALGIPARRVGVVQPGVDTHDAANPPGSSERTGGRVGQTGEREVRLLAVGTLTRRKGFDVLLRAAARLPSTGWRLTIAGPGEREPEVAQELRQLAVDLGLDGRVALPGPVDHAALERLYRQADVFAAPSRYEGYGMAVAEALAQGLPVVASRVPALADLVEDGRSGRLVPVDDPAALARALGELVRDAALRARLAEGASVRGRSLPTWREAGRAFEAELLQALA